MKTITDVKFYFMYENHTFEKLNGNTVEELLNHAEVCKKDPQGKRGMLCSAKVIYSDCSERNVGEQVNAGDRWTSGIQTWKTVVESDVEIIDFMQKRQSDVKVLAGFKFFIKKSFIDRQYGCFKANLVESRCVMYDSQFNTKHDDIIIIDSVASIDRIFDFIYNKANYAAKFNDITGVVELFIDLYEAYTHQYKQHDLDDNEAEIIMCYLIAYYCFRPKIEYSYKFLYKKLYDYYSSTGRDAEEILTGLS